MSTVFLSGLKERACSSGLETRIFSRVLTASSLGIVLRSASIARQCLDSGFGGTKSFTSTQGFDRTNIPAA